MAVAHRYKDHRRDFIQFHGMKPLPDWYKNVKELNIPDELSFQDMEFPAIFYVKGMEAPHKLWYGPFLSLEEIVSFLSEWYAGNFLYRYKYELVQKGWVQIIKD